MDQILVQINYLIREKYWCSVKNLADQELSKGQDPILTFWRAFGIFNEGSVTEAIRELSRVQDRREVQFAAAIALIFYHERCRNIDQESVDTLVLQLDQREEEAADKDLMTAASFLWHTQQLKRAGQIVSKIIESNPNNLNAQTIRGWIYLSTPKEELQQKSLQFFEQILDEESGGNRRFLEALLGKAKVFEKAKKYENSLEVLSEITVCYPGFQPALIEKSKVHIFNGDWDQAFEVITTVLAKDRTNVETLRLFVFYLLSRENDVESTLEKFDQLKDAMERNESRNADLFYNISKLFARYCGRREIYLKKTVEMLETAISIQPENAFFLTELGSQKAMLFEFSEAYNIFQKAVQYDDQYLSPLYGMILCRIKQEQLDDAAQQLDFLAEITEGNPKTSEHAYLEAILEWRKKGNKMEAIRLLDQSLNLHIQQTKTATSNIDFYIKLNSDFLMELAQEYLVHCGAKPKISSAGPPKHLIKAIKLLENVTKQNIALTEAHVLLAKAKWLHNDANAALRVLFECLQRDPAMIEAHVLAALINSENGNMKAADNNLQQAFAQDFSIRDNPVFMLMKSEVEIKQENWDDAIKTLEHAFSLPIVQDPSNPNISQKKKFSLPFGPEERCRIYINLVLAYCQNKNFDRAKQILTKAVGEFNGTPEEVRVMLAQSDLALKMGDVKKALNMLKKISPESLSFVQAKKKQAQIYLDELKDRNNYTRCYLEILDAKSSVDNFKMVANALMDIQEPEEAIQYYERALERQREDVVLIRDVGRALIMTHDYNRAVKYYETRLAEDPKLLDLRQDLAELYFKLRAFEDAKRVLIDALKYLKSLKPEIDIKSKNVQYLLLMANVCLKEDMQYADWRFKENSDAKQALIEARAVQGEVIEMCRDLSNDRLEDERELAADISYQIGKYMEERDGVEEDAVIAYNDCLSRSEKHEQALISLARLYQNSGNNEQCTQYCQRLLKIDPSNEQATFMAANLMLMKDQTEGAINTYKQLLEKRPDNFNTLAQLIELLRRAGRIQSIKSHIEAAEKSCQRTNLAGLSYCKGLYHRYIGDPIQALKFLNTARLDGLFGSSATINMIDIYLNPANEMIYTCIKDNKASEYSSTQENLTSANELIEDLKQRGLDTSIIECQAQIHSKNKQLMQKAEQHLTQVLKKNKNYVPAQTTMGLCKFLLGKQNDAKNALKVVTGNDFQLQFADYFEKAWLMMADYNTSINKYDNAETDLKKVLKHNKSNVKAEELMGQIKEKEKAYVDASEHYASAFEMSNRRNAAVGFRLAYNYIKAERYVDAIDVGREILKHNPKFPDVQEHIINKSRQCIRN